MQKRHRPLSVATDGELQPHPLAAVAVPTPARRGPPRGDKTTTRQLSLSLPDIFSLPLLVFLPAMAETEPSSPSPCRRERNRRADRRLRGASPRRPLPLRGRNRTGAPPFASSTSSPSSPAAARRGRSPPSPSTLAPTDHTHASRVSSATSWTPSCIPVRRSSSAPPLAVASRRRSSPWAPSPTTILVAVSANV